VNLMERQISHQLARYVFIEQNFQICA
jgi:hypothetical protein